MRCVHPQQDRFVGDVGRRIELDRIGRGRERVASCLARRITAVALTPRGFPGNSRASCSICVSGGATSHSRSTLGVYRREMRRQRKELLPVAEQFADVVVAVAAELTRKQRGLLIVVDRPTDPIAQ